MRERCGLGSRRAPGFTLFELVLVICLVGIFAAVALERLLRYQEIGEKMAMQRTVDILRSAAALQVAARLTRGGLDALEGLAAENPMDWLSERPANYAGALIGPPAAQAPRASWHYDRGSAELVYRPRLTRFLDPDPDQGEEIRFRVVIRLGEVGPAGRSGAIRELSEIGLRPTRPYRWTPEF